MYVPLTTFEFAPGADSLKAMTFKPTGEFLAANPPAYPASCGMLVPCAKGAGVLPSVVKNSCESGVEQAMPTNKKLEALLKEVPGAGRKIGSATDVALTLCAEAAMITVAVNDRQSFARSLKSICSQKKEGEVFKDF